MGEVSFDAVGVAYTPPGGVARRVAWVDLQSVEIVTTVETLYMEEGVIYTLMIDRPTLRLAQRIAHANNTTPSHMFQGRGLSV